MLQKCGPSRRETLKDAYVNQGVKSDTWCWYFDRPGSVQGESEKIEEHVAAP